MDQPRPRSVRVATWNMDHWKRSVETRRAAWSFLGDGLGADVALLQECVPPQDMPRSRVAYREIAGRRPWGSAVAALGEGMAVEEIGAVRTPHSSARFPMLGTYPGAVMVGRVEVPDVGPITCVSVYAPIDYSYAQTTLLRIIADLIPLFDSPDGERVILGGDFNITTAVSPSNPERDRYDAIFKAVESLGLLNVAEITSDPPPPFEECSCGDSSCRHVLTYRESRTQLDWLFATPELARRCRRLDVGDERVWEMSDHAPLVAEFELPTDLPTRRWDPDSFVRELALRAGPEEGRVAQEIIEWARRKHEHLQRAGDTHAHLDRLPTRAGEDPELWLQLDLRYPEALGWTISLRTSGEVIVQFQWMAAPPFDAEGRKRRLWSDLHELTDGQLEERLNGRPSFPLSLLTQPDALEAFLRILEEAVGEMVTHHRPELREPH